MGFAVVFTAPVVNSLGVVLVTCGALLLWRFVGEVVFVNKREILSGAEVVMTIPHATPELRAKLRRDQWLMRGGVVMTVSGGVLQVVASCLS